MSKSEPQAFQAGNAGSNPAGDTVVSGGCGETGGVDPTGCHQTSSLQHHHRRGRRATIRLDPEALRPAAERLGFAERIAEPNPAGCRLWTGGKNNRGYGKAYVGGPPGAFALAHRIAWVLERGEIPADLTVDHLCFRPLCCNPAHMELVSLSENSRRQNERRRLAKVSR